MGYFRESPHTLMDEIRNPAENNQWTWLEIHEFPPNFVNFNRNSRKTIQSLGIPQDFESAVFGILQKLLLSFLEILNFLGIQFSVVHGGGGDIFWNSPMEKALT